jgi:hypothetical protein
MSSESSSSVDVEMPQQPQEMSPTQCHVLCRGDSAAPLPNTNPPTVDDIVFVAHQISGAGSKVDDEETPQARIERLGRERPEKFKTIWAEIGFVFSIAMSQVLTVRLDKISRLSFSLFLFFHILSAPYEG